MTLGRASSFTAVLLLVTLAGCSESIVIRSTPPGATVYADNRQVGTTPTEFTVARRDIKPYTLRLEKVGYEPVADVITTRLAPGRLVGALFSFGIVYLFRSPMCLRQPPVYELVPVFVAGQGPERAQALEDALRNLRELHERGSISDAEFTRRREDLLKAAP